MIERKWKYHHKLSKYETKEVEVEVADDFVSHGDEEKFEFETFDEMTS
jgi:hypothetical protein